jgi:hypothetical protein
VCRVVPWHVNLTSTLPPHGALLYIYSSFSLPHIYILSVVRIMTSSSPTPDIASLSLSSQSTHQRLHDTYDFDGTGNVRQYHYATSPPAPPSQSPFLPLSMNQSPLKSKTARAGLPSVRPPFFSPWIIIINIHYLHMLPFLSNGSMVVPRTLTIALCLPLTIQIFPLVEVRRLSHTSTPLRPFLLQVRVPMMRLYPPLLSSKTSLLMSNARLFWTSSYVLCHASPFFPFIISLTGFPVHSNPVCIQLPPRSVRLFQGSCLCQFPPGL